MVRRELAAIFVGLVFAEGDVVHRGFDDCGFLFRGELDQVLLGGKFDVRAETVGVKASLLDEALACSGNGFEVNVAAKVMLGAKGFGYVEELLHGVVGGLDDAGGEKEAFDVVALVEVEGKLDDLVGSEAGAPDVGGDAIDAEDAVVGAEVGEEDFEEGDAAAVGGVAVAYAHAVGVADALRRCRCASLLRRRRTHRTLAASARISSFCWMFMRGRTSAFQFDALL